MSAALQLTERPTTSASQIEISAVQPTIGAEILGVDLRAPLADTVRSEIRAAVLKHKVVFFRDQHLTQPQHEAFAQQFGPLYSHPSSKAVDQRPAIHQILPHEVKPQISSANKPLRDGYHTDTSWRLVPAWGAVLRAVHLPPTGGDTIWVDAGLAYRELPDDIKQRLEGLHVTHDYRSSLNKAGHDYPIVAHPIVRVHRETGEKILWANFSQSPYLVGLDRSESHELLTYVLDQYRRPEYQVRIQLASRLPGILGQPRRRALRGAQLRRLPARHGAGADRGRTPLRRPVAGPARHTHSTRRGPMTTRRQFTRLLGGSLMTGSALVRTLAGAAAQAAPVSPRPGGELQFALDGAAVVQFVLDPHNSGFAPHNRVFRSIYDCLVVLLPDQTVGPWLARSWQISADQTVYTFTLRNDVTFHDGTRFDATAVKANLDRIANPNNALVALPDIGSYHRAEVLADDTVRVTLSEPFAPLLRNLSKTTLGIVSPAALARNGDAIGSNPVGSGPFRFVSMVQGTEIRLARNPDYRWAPASATHGGPAYLDALLFRNVPEEATRVASLQSRQVHAADGIPPQYIQALKSDPGLRLLQKELLNNNYTLYPNVARAPWNDEDMRLAFRMSLDIDMIVRVIYLGTEPRAWAPLSPSMFASADTQLRGSWKPDYRRAAEILQGKGWITGDGGVRVKDGKRLSVSFIDTQGNREKRLDVIRLARRQLAKSGFELTIDGQPACAAMQKLSRNEFDLSGASQFAPDPDVLRRLHLPAGRPASSVSKVDDAEISQWLTEGMREADAETRAGLYANVQRKLVEQSLAIPIYTLLYNIGTTAVVNGIDIDTHGFPQFHGAWLSA